MLLSKVTIRTIIKGIVPLQHPWVQCLAHGHTWPIAHGSLLLGLETSIFRLPALSSNHNAAESHVKTQTQPLTFLTVLRFSHEAKWIHVYHVDKHKSDMPTNFSSPFIYLVIHCTELSSLFHFVTLSVPSLPGGREQH